MTNPRTDSVVLVIAHEQVHTLLSIFDSAARGRDDVEYLAGREQGDYEKADIAAARESHAKQVALEEHLRLAIEMQTPPVEVQAPVADQPPDLRAVPDERHCRSGSDRAPARPAVLDDNTHL
jgi:hypothetical protein